MKRILRVILKGLGALAVLVAAVLGFGAWQYHHTMTITALNGIDESRYVRIGGIDQWVQIRGEDKSNPVLLWLNGGPGGSTIANTYFFRNWEKHFTLLMWDQRGEGKTFAKSGETVAPTMTIGRMTQDGIELTNYLRGRLHKDKIILLGHSWGSILGVHMARERPDLFAAYVGTGQVHQMRDDTMFAYARLLARARAAHNEQAVKELEAAGPPPYTDPAKYLVPLQWANALDPPIRFSVAPASVPGGLWAALMSLPEISSFSRGGEFSVKLLLGAILKENLSIAAPKLDVPVIIMAGSEDLVTPDAKVFFDTVQAPHKEFLTINGGGHLAVIGRRDDFLKLLVSHARPLAQ
jgi:pimeloyl-ACP methyl ester carboxylesterase